MLAQPHAHHNNKKNEMLFKQCQKSRQSKCQTKTRTQKKRSKQQISYLPGRLFVFPFMNRILKFARARDFARESEKWKEKCEQKNRKRKKSNLIHIWRVEEFQYITLHWHFMEFHHTYDIYPLTIIIISVKSLECCDAWAFQLGNNCNRFDDSLRLMRMRMGIA